MKKAAMQNEPKMKDVAKEAGVSLSTASNVLSGRRQVDSPTGQRVLEVAARLGYVHKNTNTLKRRIRFLIYKKSGMVVMDTPFFSELIAGVEHECEENGYELVISYLAASEENIQGKLRPILSDHSSPILLLATEMNEDDIAPFLELDVPVLVVDNLFTPATFHTVVMNNRDAGIIATEHLIQSGHRRIGHISSTFPFNNMVQRCEGYKAAMDKAGLPYSSEDIFSIEPTLEGSYRDMKQIILEKGKLDQTAFFVGNDIMTVGAARAMKECGISLPRDVSLIGMDDMPMCQVVNPALSTIHVPKREMGAIAVNTLVRMADGKESTPTQTLVSVSLVSRDSVCRVAGA